MPEKFDKNLRARVHNSIGGAFDPARTRAYLEALEEIAKAGADVWQYTLFVPKGQQQRYQRLADALQKVDWMRE